MIYKYETTMINPLIQFKNIAWAKPSKGMEQKVYTDENKRMRLVKFNDDFIEKDWCTNGHIGYVIEGEMQIDFNRELKHYKKGEGLWINNGEKHKVIIAKGNHVFLILFESIK